jgi:hypothetical protein
MSAIAELMGAGPAKRECSASRLYRRETAAYLSGPSTKRTCKVPRQRIVAAGVKKQNVCLRSVRCNLKAMAGVEEQAYICTRQCHGEVADFPIKTHLRQIDPINDFEASLFLVRPTYQHHFAGSPGLPHVGRLSCQ